MPTPQDYEDYIARLDLEEQDEDEKRGLLADTAVGIVRGIPSALKEANEGIDAAADWLNSKVNLGTVVFGQEADNGIIGYTFDQRDDLNAFGGLVAPVAETALDVLPETERATGEVAEGISRFASGFLFGGKLVGAFNTITGISRAATATSILGRLTNVFGRGAAAGAISDYLTTDIDEGNLSNLVNGLTGMDIPLAIDEDDSEIEARLKTVAEGGAFGAGLEGVFRGIRAWRGGRRLKAAQEADRLEAEQVKNDQLVTEEIERERAIEAGESSGIEVEGFTAEDFGFDATFVPVREMADDNFYVGTDAAGKTMIHNTRFGADNRLVLQERGDAVQIIDVFVEEGARHQGIGTSLYNVAIDQAFEAGKRIISDVQLSPQAIKRWNALERAGYVVKRAEDIVAGPNGTSRSASGGPLFEVMGRNADAPATPTTNLRPIPKLITASTQSADDILQTLVQHIENSGRTVDEVVAALSESGDITALRKGGLNFNTVDWDSFGEHAGDLKRVIALYGDAYDQAFLNAEKTSVDEIAARAKRVLARDVDAPASSLFKDLRQDGGIAGRVLASQQLLAESFERMTQMAKELSGPYANETTRRAFLRQQEIHRALYAQVRGSTGEVARAMRAMQIMKTHNAADAKVFNDMLLELRIDPDNADLVNRIANFKHQHELSREVARTGWQKTGAVLTEILYGNLLSSPATLVANTMGNAYKTVRSLTDPLAGSIVSTLRGRRAESIANLVETQANLFGIVAGLRDSFMPNLRVIRQGLEEGGGVRSLLHKPGRTQLIEYAAERKALGNVWQAVATGGPVTSATGRGVPRQPALKIELDPEKYHNMSLRGLAALLTNTTGKAIRFFPGVIMATDELFKTIAHRQSIYADVFKQAEAMRRTPGSPYYQASRSSIADELLPFLMRDQEANIKATAWAQEQTFQQSGGKYIQGIEGFIKNVPVLRVVIPFVRTPGNLFRESLETVGGPLALLSQRNREVLAKGGAEADKLIAQSVIATGVTGAAVLWALDDRIVGGGSGNNSSRLDGVPPYSIRIGDTWHTFNRLDPLGMVVGFVADLVEGSERAIEDYDGIDAWTEAGAAGLTAILQNASSKTWLQGLSDLVLVMEDPQRYSSDFIASIGANLIPFAGSSFQRRRAATDDPFAREVFTFMDALRQRGMFGAEGRQDLGVRRDPLGRPIEDTSSMFQVIRSEQKTTDPVMLSLAELDFNIPMPAKAVGGVPLNTVQYSRLLELRGQVSMDGAPTLESALRTLVLSAEFDRQYDEGKIYLIETLVNRYSAAARTMLQEEQEGLRLQIGARKVDEARERTPVPPTSDDPLGWGL